MSIGQFPLSSTSGVNSKEAPNAPDSTSLATAAIVNFLRRCGFEWPHIEYDYAFHEACCAHAVKMGYPIVGEQSLEPFIPPGVAMAVTSYAHLEDLDAQIYIALYTAFLIYADDVFKDDVSRVVSFQDRFLKGLPHEDPVMHCFDGFLREMHVRYEPVVANIMMTSTLNLLTALLTEHTLRSKEIGPSAIAYPPFARALCGASEAYTLFIYPPRTPVHQYLLTLPDTMKYLNFGNDILSFYKEELGHEDDNHISLVAHCKGESKLAVLQQLIDETVAAHERSLKTLAPYPETLAMYKSFAYGYFGFHAGSARYRLEELNL